MAPGSGAPRSLHLRRRDFLAATGAAALGLGAGGVAAARAEPPGPPRVRGRAVLGRTGLEVPDIGFGGSRLRAGQEALVHHALERGITYFDTAESYTGGESERTLGRALQGRRDGVTLASKVKAEAGDRWPAIMQRLDASLRRLRTDRIDVYFNHAVNDVDRLRNPEWGELVERARKAGKIRFTGMSGHAGRLVECLDFALDEDLVDVVLVGYNFGQDPAFYERFTRSFDFVALQPELPRVLARASRQRVGVVAMKTLRGGKLNDLEPFEEGGATFAQAAFRWVLSNDDVDALIVTMKTPEQVDEYLGASGARRAGLADAALLSRYEALHGATQCRYGCDACAGACPEGVPLSDVLRVRMYAEDYGDPELAREEHARLGRPAAACAGCSHQACAGACPFGLDLPALACRAAGL